jgi:hypothetical protein
MRRFLAGKVSVVEDGRMDGYYEEGEKYRNKRNYVPLVLPSAENRRNRRVGRGLFAPNVLDCGAAPSSCTARVHSGGQPLVLRINHRKSLRPEKEPYSQHPCKW